MNLQGRGVQMSIRKSMIYAALIMLAMLSSYAATNFSPNSGVYLILDITVDDEQTYEQYRQKVKPLVESFGGTYVVRAGAKFVSDNPTSGLLQTGGEWNPDRIIVLHFDSPAPVSQFFDSPEYKEIVHLRTSSSSTRLVLVNAYHPDN
jgi:uncharacterized protein (DUF1330 family)